MHASSFVENTFKFWIGGGHGEHILLLGKYTRSFKSIVAATHKLAKRNGIKFLNSVISFQYSHLLTKLLILGVWGSEQLPAAIPK